ncbi:MAG: hypothetical protein ACR2NZ_07555 [Rubripirellula sp.]
MHSARMRVAQLKATHTPSLEQRDSVIWLSATFRDELPWAHRHVVAEESEACSLSAPAE